MSGIVDNQVGVLFTPVPHGPVPYPQLRNLVDKGYTDYNVLRNLTKIYRVPNAIIDTAPTTIELPEPFLHDSVLYFRNGVLDALTTFVELNNLEVQIPQAPLTGSNREILEFEYLPAYLVGRNAYKNYLMFTFSSSRTLTDIMVSYSAIRVETLEVPVTMTLPSLTSDANGSRVIFFRDGEQNVIITPPSGVTIDNYPGSYTIVNDLEGIELIYTEINSVKRWNITGRLGY